MFALTSAVDVVVDTVLSADAVLSVDAVLSADAVLSVDGALSPELMVMLIG